MLVAICYPLATTEVAEQQGAPNSDDETFFTLFSALVTMVRFLDVGLWPMTLRSVLFQYLEYDGKLHEL